MHEMSLSSLCFLNQSPWRHDTFDNLSITIPDETGRTLEQLLKQYVTPEFIDDFVCSKCSLLATQKKLRQELEGHNSKSKKPSSSGHRKLMEHIEFIDMCINNANYDAKMVLCIDLA
jgi:hypothetical protein